MIIYLYTKADDYNNVNILDNISETELCLIKYKIL